MKPATPLSATQLMSFGGLRERCSAKLRCVAHGTAVPCEICDLEDRHDAVCGQCDHRFVEATSYLMDRPCKSAFEFERTGKIAFPAEAERAIRRHREFATTSSGESRSTAARPPKSSVPVPPPENSVESMPSAVRRDRSGGSAYKWIVGLAICALIGIGGKSRWWDRAADSAGAVGAPATTAVPARPPAAPPSASGSSTLPAMSGYVTDVAGTVPMQDKEYLQARLSHMRVAGTTVRIVFLGSVEGEDITQFSRRLGNAWNANTASVHTDILIVVATKDRHVRIETTDATRRVLTDQVASGMIGEYFVPVAHSSGPVAASRSLVDQIERQMSVASASGKGADAASVRRETMTGIARIMDAVQTWDATQPSLSPSQAAALDSEVARLESMPRPARGDRKVARQLHAQGIALLHQAGFEPLAIEKLQRATSADPLDVQIVNDLAFAHLQASNPLAAQELLLQTLRLSPKRTSAWMNLGEVVAIRNKPLKDDLKVFASTLFVAGYWFSKDRAQAMSFLREKAASAEVDEGVRQVATHALTRLGAGVTGANPIQVDVAHR